jgi:hypothetical protein
MTLLRSRRGRLSGSKEAGLREEAGDAGWSLLKGASKATGAVSVALASRILTRDVADYLTPAWEPLSADAAPIRPAFPPDIPATWHSNAQLPQGNVWMPIIPLCGSAMSEVENPVRRDITGPEVDSNVELVMGRLDAIRTKLVPGQLGGIISDAIHSLVTLPILKQKTSAGIKEAIMNAMSPPV